MTEEEISRFMRIENGYPVNTIYKLTNIINNKIYIGQTWMEYKYRSGKTGNGYANSKYLFSAIKKYGFDKFQQEELAICLDQKTADDVEDYYINVFNSRDHDIGYNLKTGGSAGRHAEETKNKISETLKNKEWSEEAIQNRLDALRARKGEKREPHTEERKLEISEFSKEWHANNQHPMLGTNHTEVAREQIGKTLRTGYTSGEIKPYERTGYNPMRTPQDEEQEIIQRYLDCKGVPGAATKLYHEIGISKLNRILHRNNIQLHGSGSSMAGRVVSEETKEKLRQPRPRKKITEEFAAQVIDMYNSGESNVNMINKFNIGSRLIKKILKDNNIPKRPNISKKKIDEETQKNLLNDFNSGKTLRSLKEKYNLTGDVLKRTLRENGIKI
jgi:group I intron endonuclease